VHDLRCICGKVSLIGGNVIPIHVDCQSNVTHSGKVFGNVDIETFQALIVVYDQDQRAWPRGFRWRNHVAQELIPMKFNANAFATQARIFWPQLGIGFHNLPPLSCLVQSTLKDSAAATIVQEEQTD
jgi:hypothetical protein